MMWPQPPERPPRHWYIKTASATEAACAWQGTSGLESLLSEIKLDVSRDGGRDTIKETLDVSNFYRFFC